MKNSPGTRTQVIRKLITPAGENWRQEAEWDAVMVFSVGEGAMLPLGAGAEAGLLLTFVGFEHENWGGLELCWSACVITPSMPWHLIVELVHIFGVMIWILFRKKCLLPPLKTWSMVSGLRVGIIEPVGKCCRSSKNNEEGMVCLSKNWDTSLLRKVELARIRSLGMRKVTFPCMFMSSGAMLMSTTNV